MTHDEVTQVDRSVRFDDVTVAQPDSAVSSVTTVSRRRITPAQALYAVLWQGLPAAEVARYL